MAEQDARITHKMADYEARSLAQEAIQACRSHEAMDKLQFDNMARIYEDIKASMENMSNRMDAGFKSYDAKFWSLAITLITLLLSAVGMLLYKIIFASH